MVTIEKRTSTFILRLFLYQCTVVVVGIVSQELDKSEQNVTDFGAIPQEVYTTQHGGPLVIKV